MRTVSVAVLLSLSLFAASPLLAENILRVGVRLEPPNLDPTQGAAAAVDEIVYANVFEGLTAIASNGAVVPRLAKRWDVSPDGRTYRFHLQRGVRFHDGSSFDADDVKFSMTRAGAPDSTNAQKSLFEPIAHIDVVDTHTVDFVLQRPVGAFLQHLAWGDAVIVSAETAKTNVSHPIGTGPFRYSRWRKGVSIDLSRNTEYWGPTAGIDGISFRIIPDPTAAFASLMAGDVDGFPAYPAPENLAQFSRHGHFNVVVGSSEGETILAINNALPPFDDIRVRRALSHAIDKRALIDGAMFGYGTPIGSHFPPHHPAYVELSDRYDYDTEKARALLRDAGFEDGFETVLKLPPPSYARRSGELIAAQLAAIGVRVKIENLEWAQWLDQVFSNKNYALTIVSHTEPLDLDIYAREDYYFQYNSSDFNQLIAILSMTDDPSERNVLFRQAQQQLSDDAVNVFLFQWPKMAIWAEGVEGAWKDAPLQANDFTAVNRTGLTTTGQAAGSNVVLATAMSTLGLLCAFGLVVLVYRAGSAYVLRRLVSIVATLFVATLVIFVLVEVAPGDPATYMMGLNAEPEALAALRQELGLDKSAAARYLSWVGGLSRGDFGISYTYRTPIAGILLERLQVSLPLALYAIFLAVVLAVPAGIVAARRRGRLADSAIMGVTQIGIALPNFWIAILLALTFAGYLRWFPVGGFPGWEAGLFAGLHALTLPAIALAVPQAAILARVTRSALLDTLHED